MAARPLLSLHELLPPARAAPAEFNVVLAGRPPPSAAQSFIAAPHPHHLFISLPRTSPTLYLSLLTGSFIIFINVVLYFLFTEIIQDI